MEPVHVKEALSHHDREHFCYPTEGDGSFQHAIEGVINMVEEGITIRSKKQTIFFHC